MTPEYYGMLLFAQAFPAGARLLPVNAPAGSLKIWATKAKDGTTRVVLINKSASTAADVQLNLPNSTAPATLGRLTAPSVDSTSGVTLNGQTFGSETSTGTLAGTQQTATVTPVGGEYTIDVPAGSAALLTQ